MFAWPINVRHNLINVSPSHASESNVHYTMIVFYTQEYELQNFSWNISNMCVYAEIPKFEIKTIGETPTKSFVDYIFPRIRLQGEDPNYKKESFT